MPNICTVITQSIKHIYSLPFPIYEAEFNKNFLRISKFAYL